MSTASDRYSTFTHAGVHASVVVDAIVVEAASSDVATVDVVGGATAARVVGDV